MNKLLITAVLIAATVTTGTMKATAADFSDRTEYTCDNDVITLHMKGIAEQNILGPKVIYVKSATEVSRKSNELRCNIVVVHSKGSQNGMFRFYSEDGHDLVQFRPR